MNLKRTLLALVKVLVEEADRNPSFRSRLEEALDAGGKPSALGPNTQGSRSTLRHKPEEGRKRGRRSAAVLDPIDLVAQGETELRERLSGLDLEQLLDIVAQYGMDPGKLVMKWKDRDRVIDRVIEVAAARATKGDSFRKD